MLLPKAFPPGKLEPEQLFLPREQTQRGLVLLTELIGAKGLLSR